MEARVTPALLVIADISGFTRFMLSHDKALAHSQMIVGGLMEALMAQVDRPLTVVEVEGDALFMYAPRAQDATVRAGRGRFLLDRIRRMFHTFDRQRAEMAAYSICHCQACASLSELKLKVVVHAGEVVLSRVGDFPVLAGPDVIMVHRLLKNSVGARQYVLVTEPALADLPVPDGVTVHEGSESYDAGTIRTRYWFPDSLMTIGPAELVASFSEDNIGVRILRHEVQREYTDVAAHPDRGYHFNTGRVAMEATEYDPAWIACVPDTVAASFAGTGNPFSMGVLKPGEHVVDVGCGAGTDAIIAAHMVGRDGHVIGIDMTPAMVEKASAAAAEAGLEQIEFREGFAEALPVPDGWADVVLSNGAINLCPDKGRAYAEMFRVLRPGGRLQVADITVERAVPETARRDVDLWTN